MNSRAPSPIADALLARCLDRDQYEVITGDLSERFTEEIKTGVPLGAARRHWRRQALASLAAVVGARVRRRLADATGRMWHPGSPFRGLGGDIRYVGRQLAHARGYAAVAVLSLAFGIGGSTAAYRIAYRLFIQPLAVERPEELGLPYWGDRTRQTKETTNIGADTFRDALTAVDYSSAYSYDQYTAFTHAISPDVTIAAFAPLRDLTLSRPGQPGLVTTGLLVSGSFFDVLRPPFALGRSLSEGDDARGAPASAVLSHAVWISLFGGDPHVLGATLRVSGTPVTVVGVMGAAFDRLSPDGTTAPPDVVLTLAQQPVIEPQWNRYAGGQSLFVAPDVNWLFMLTRDARRQPDSLAQDLTNAYRQSLVGSARASDQAARPMRVHVFSGARSLDPMPTTALPPIVLLSSISGVVLLVACLNIAGLTIARVVARRREFALRRALGARAWRLVRERIVESAMLSAAGGSIGILFARTFTPLMFRFVTRPPAGGALADFGLDVPAVATAAVICCATAFVTGVVPALWLTVGARRVSSIHAMAGRHVPRLRISHAFLAAQVVGTVPLIAGALLFLRTFENLARVDPGFDPHGLVIVSADSTIGGRLPDRARDFYPQAIERLSSVPGIVSVTLVENALFSGASDTLTALIDGTRARLWANAVGPRYFETLAIPIRAGRPIDERDDGSAPGVAVINETAARRYFAGVTPLGHRIALNSHLSVDVVGVSGDSHYTSLREAVPPTIFLSYLQMPAGPMHVIVRSAIDAPSLERSILATIAAIENAPPVTAIRSQTDQINATIRREQLMAGFVTIFGGVVLAVACIGLYGVTSYLIAERTNEVGIRLALGATRRQVVRLVARQVATVMAVGLPAGLLVTWLAAPLVGAMVFGLPPRDVGTMALAVAIVAGASLTAAFTPARRAARVDPLTALRVD